MVGSIAASKNKATNEGNTDKNLRLAATQAMLCECFYYYTKYSSEKGHPSIKDEYLPLFTARCSQIKSEVSDRSIADQLIGRYPNMPILDTKNNDEVKGIIEKLLSDEDLAIAVSNAMKSDKILYEVFMERKGTSEERRDNQFLKRELRKKGHSANEPLHKTLSYNSRAECEVVSNCVEKIFENLFKEGQMKRDWMAVGGGERPVDWSKVGEMIFQVMRIYYGTDLNFDDEGDAKKRGILVWRRSSL